MANLCCNTVHLIGDKLALDRIMDAHNRIQTPVKTLEALQEQLQFECEGWGRSYDDGISSIEFDDNGHLVIDCCTAWGSVDDYWIALSKFLGLEKWASWSELDSEIFVVNDDNGEIFPTQYMLEVWDETDYDLPDDRVEFKTEDELLAYLNEKIGTAKTLAEYEELIDDEGWGSIVTVERT